MADNKTFDTENNNNPLLTPLLKAEVLQAEVAKQPVVATKEQDSIAHDIVDLFLNTATGILLGNVWWVLGDIASKPNPQTQTPPDSTTTQNPSSTTSTATTTSSIATTAASNTFDSAVLSTTHLGLFGGSIAGSGASSIVRGIKNRKDMTDMQKFILAGHTAGRVFGIGGVVMLIFKTHGFKIEAETDLFIASFTAHLITNIAEYIKGGKAIDLLQITGNAITNAYNPVAVHCGLDTTATSPKAKEILLKSAAILAYANTLLQATCTIIKIVQKYGADKGMAGEKPGSSKGGAKALTSVVDEEDEDIVYRYV